jgi:hypothetical protein
MTDVLAPIATKLAIFVRLLPSDKDGEIIAAAHAIKRTLGAAGTDMHALAERIEESNGNGLSEAEMKKLYDAGYSDGQRDAENKRFGPADFHNIDGTPDWHQMALYCQQRSNLLRGQESTFINDMASRTVWREPTEKQAKWLRSIFHRLGGRI